MYLVYSLTTCMCSRVQDVIIDKINKKCFVRVALMRSCICQETRMRTKVRSDVMQGLCRFINRDKLAFTYCKHPIIFVNCVCVKFTTFKERKRHCRTLTLNINVNVM